MAKKDYDMNEQTAREYGKNVIEACKRVSDAVELLARSVRAEVIYREHGHDSAAVVRYEEAQKEYSQACRDLSDALNLYDGATLALQVEDVDRKGTSK